MQHRFKELGVLILAGLLMTALLVPATTSGQAERPEWEEGDVWAMGAEGDIEEIFKPTLDMIDGFIEQELAEDEEIEEFDYNIDGEMGFYQVYEVVEVNDDGYVMEVEAGGGIQASVSLEVTGQFYEEGEYDWDEDIPTESRTMSLEADLSFTLDIEGTVHFDEDMAIEEMELEYALDFSLEFSAENFPMEDYDWQNDTITVRYEDFSGGIFVEITVEMYMEFEPALDIFNFPIDLGDWLVESQMTISGSYEGVIDIDYEDMPEEFQEMIKEIEEELEQEFPIILEELDTEDEDMNFGEIKETTEHMEIHMRCTGREEIVLWDGSTTNAWVLESVIEEDIFPPNDIIPLDMITLQQVGPSLQMFYSEEAGFIVSQRMDLGPEMGSMLGVQTMEMRSMDVEEAREGKEEIQEEEDDEIPGFGVLTLLSAIGVIVIITWISKKDGKRPKQEMEHDDLDR